MPDPAEPQSMPTAVTDCEEAAPDQRIASRRRLRTPDRAGNGDPAAARLGRGFVTHCLNAVRHAEDQQAGKQHGASFPRGPARVRRPSRMPACGRAPGVVNRNEAKPAASAMTTATR
jgi:hypothetical protein